MRKAMRSTMNRTMSLIFLVSALTAMGQVSTRGYDNARTGMNSAETHLNQLSVSYNGLRVTGTVTLPGDKRGMEAQPLIDDANNVMILATLNNTVMGVNPATGQTLWTTNLGVSVTGSPKIDMHLINDHWGCLSTGVIIPSTHRFYTACWISIDKSGTPASGRYFLFALNTKDGSQTMQPVPLQGADTSMWKQRSSLLYVPKYNTIFIAHGSVYETASGYTGGITAFDVASAKIKTLPFSVGIWMAGCGLISDANGYIYAVTGNGDFDPAQGWYGESFIKMTYDTASMALKVIDQWSPWTDEQRTGQSKPPAGAKLSGLSMPSEALKPVGGNMSISLKNASVKSTINDKGEITALVYPSMAQGSWSDEDWGSAGPACIFSLGECIVAGKDGIGYPISTTSLGGTTASTVGTQANYKKLVSPCVWLTMSPGNNTSCSPVDAKTLNFFPWGDTAHLHMTPVQVYDPVLKAWTIFVWGENEQLHKWQVKNGITYVAQSNEYASIESRNRAPGGMPGGFCSASSNNGAENSMLLYCSIPYGDANSTITNGRLLVYDPIHLASDGSLKVLWDSQKWGIAYIYNKFMPPMVWKGRVYLPTYSGTVLIIQ